MQTKSLLSVTSGGILAFALIVPQAAFGATITGKIAGGGGIDDLFIVVKGASGQTVKAYCNQKCGDWFVEGEHEVQTLRKEFINKKVVMEYKAEKNNDRIAGWGEDSPPTFVKKITLAK